MQKNYLLIFIFLLFWAFSFSQRTMIVQKTGSHTKLIFNVGDEIRLRTISPDTVIEGRIYRIWDSAIVVNGSDLVKISNIGAVRRTYWGTTLLSKLFQISFVTFFSITTVNGIINNEQVFKKENLIVSGALLTAAVVTTLLRHHWVKIEGRWSIIVLDRHIYK